MDGSGWKSAAAEREDGWPAADLVLVLTGCSRGERLRERWGGLGKRTLSSGAVPVSSPFLRKTCAPKWSKFTVYSHSFHKVGLGGGWS